MDTAMMYQDASAIFSIVAIALTDGNSLPFSVAILRAYHRNPLRPLSCPERQQLLTVVFLCNTILHVAAPLWGYCPW
jgi:hypothetical protein